MSTPTAQFSHQRFVVAGMPRAATTFLYHNLQRHPGVFLTARKEMNYFSVHHERGRDWYDAQFGDAASGRMVGDISPSYFLDPDVPRRILDHDPTTRVILGVREPVAWVRSFYAQLATFHFTMPPFEEFLEGFDYVIGDTKLRLDFGNDAIIDAIDRFRDAFGPRLLLFDFAHFERDRLDVLRAIESFLDLKPWFEAHRFDDVKINAASRKNSRAVSWLLSREWFIRAVETLVPRSIVVTARRGFDRMSVRDGETPAEHSTTHAEAAEAILDSQRDAIARLFESGPLVRGDGRPVEIRREVLT